MIFPEEQNLNYPEANHSEKNTHKETKISPEAQAKLLEWKFSAEQVIKLEAIINYLDYGSCEQKVNRMIQEPPIIVQGEMYTSIAIPKFHDIALRSDGVCEDLARKLLIEASDNHLLKEIRANNPDVNFYYCFGKNERFFVKSPHVWVEISQKGNSTENRVIIDPSLGVIEVYTQSGYHHDTLGKENPQEFFDYQTEFLIASPKEELISEPSLANIEIRTKTIGISADKRLMYSIGYLLEDSNPLPYLKVLDEDGISFSLISLDKDELQFISPKIDSILPTNISEITRILMILNNTLPRKAVNKEAEDLLFQKNKSIKVKYD